MDSPVSTDALRQYRHDITEHIAHSWAASGENQHALVEAHLPLVISLARRYEGAGIDLLDLIQEGNLGLLRAAHKFDPSLGFQFATYATWWIKQYILSALSQRLVPLSVSRDKRERLQRLLRMQQQMQQEKAGDEPTLDELAERMETSVASVQKTLALQQIYAMSIDTSRGVDEDETLADHLESNPEQAPEHLALLQSRNEHLQRLLLLLTKAEREVILLRYGLKDGKEQSLNAVATALKKNWDTVVSLEQRALMKMRRLARLKQLQDFLT